ncbi:MAG: hypothetical protein NTW21_34935 [Verrucomicrobia bacterium]|nr:hypothetical protein [Verrucomicrobiota bacterium]
MGTPRPGSYLEPAAGRANLNLFAMAREELSYAVFVAFQRALRKKDVVVMKGIQAGTRSPTRAVDLAVYPIKEPETEGWGVGRCVKKSKRVFNGAGCQA